MSSQASCQMWFFFSGGLQRLDEHLLRDALLDPTLSKGMDEVISEIHSKFILYF